jgi:hypothetical protein
VLAAQMLELDPLSTSTGNCQGNGSVEVLMKRAKSRERMRKYNQSSRFYRRGVILHQDPRVYVDDEVAVQRGLAE